MRGRVVGVLVLSAVLLAVVPAVPVGGGEAVSRVQRAVLEGLPAAEGQTAREGLSEPVRTPQPFSLVGVSVPAGARVFLRTGAGPDAWSPWLEAEPLAADGDGPDPGSAEAAAANPGWQRMSEPLWVDEASWLQLRVAGGTPDDVAVHLVDSLGQARSVLERASDALRAAWRGTAATTAEASTRPAIVTRAQWGADESLRRGTPDYSSSTRAGVLHHTATSNDYSRERAPAVVRAIYAYHTQSLGWSDIGYNLLVDRYGTVYEGRAGGLDRGVIGAHAGGFNTETFGVSIIGTFMSGLPPGPALDAAVSTIAWKFAVHGISNDPNATVDITSRGSTRYPKDHRARLHTLSGHRDVSTTACPGDALYPHLAELRRQVQARSAPPPPPPPPPPAPGRRLLPPLDLPLSPLLDLAEPALPDLPFVPDLPDLPLPEALGSAASPADPPRDRDLPVELPLSLRRDRGR